MKPPGITLGAILIIALKTGTSFAVEPDDQRVRPINPPTSVTEQNNNINANQEHPEEKSTSVERFILKVSEYKSEASTLEADEVYRDIQITFDSLKFKSKGLVSLPDLNDEETAKLSGYLLALKMKKDNGDFLANYYYGLHNLRECASFESAAKNDFQETTVICYKESIDNFKAASEHGIERASFAVGMMFEKGLGVIASNLIAADWYIKAARQSVAGDNREFALRSIESALRVMPENKIALKIKAEIFN